MSNTINIKKTELEISSTFSGDQLSIPIFEIFLTSTDATSLDDPYNIYIQSSMHGSELQGNAVIYELISMLFNCNKSFLPLLKCPLKFTLVPLANPLALNQKIHGHTIGRFNVQSGENYNRTYVNTENLILDIDLNLFFQDNYNDNYNDNHNHHKNWDEIKSNYKKLLKQKLIENRDTLVNSRGISYQQRLNIELQILASSADIVLDLHTAAQGMRYIFAPLYCYQNAFHFNFPLTIVIPNKFAGAMDEASFTPWYHLKKFFQEKNVEIPLEFESYTLELGNEESIDFKAAKIDAQNILHYLAFKKIFDHQEFNHNDINNNNNNKCSYQAHSELKNYLTYYSPHSGLVEFIKKPGEIIKKGETVAKILNFKNFIANKNYLDKDLINLNSLITEVAAKNDSILVNHCSTASISAGSELFKVIENYNLI
ncbi:MAG: succinylglutamate desuccinylase/aspartoacylase family protein [Oligoflexia bacterium]|nr:succinylglutamate desuccinylase/aspartoacylase family protein [Oligoflexia bacterium]